MRKSAKGEGDENARKERTRKEASERGQVGEHDDVREDTRLNEMASNGAKSPANVVVPRCEGTRADDAR